jgi:DNA-binding transcriptional LysR family regulator
MNSQQVRYFLAVCAERNFTRAARCCGISQPSLTVAIKRLEREVGGTLFLRSAPVQLTPFGAMLVPLFEQIKEAFVQIEVVGERTRAMATEHAPPPAIGVVQANGRGEASS